MAILPLQPAAPAVFGNTSEITMNTPIDPNAPKAVVPPLQPALTVAAVASNEAKLRWPGLIGAAKLRWSKLTDAELHKTAGNEHQLAVLVQGRYDIPRGDAYRQVKSFHDSQKV